MKIIIILFLVLFFIGCSDDHPAERWISSNEDEYSLDESMDDFENGEYMIQFYISMILYLLWRNKNEKLSKL